MTNNICECGHPPSSHRKDDRGEEYCHDCGKDTSGGMGSSYHKFSKKGGQHNPLPPVEEPKWALEAQDNKAFLDIVKTNPSLTLSIPAQNLVRLGWLAALQYKRGRNK